MPDELWTEVRDTVQETGSNIMPKKKKCKKAKWLSEEALQIAVKKLPAEHPDTGRDSWRGARGGRCRRQGWAGDP